MGERVRSRARTPRRARARTAQIVQAASAMIAEKGYFGFSLGELATCCGLSNAGLIHHIGSKAHLLEMVLAERDRRDMAALGYDPDAADVTFFLPLDGSRTDHDDGGAQVLHRLVAHNATQPTMVHLYATLRAEALSPTHPSHAYFVDRDRRAVAAFATLLEGVVPDPLATARAALALMGGLEEQWLRSPQEVDLVAAWDQAYAALLAGSRSRRRGTGTSVTPAR